MKTITNKDSMFASERSQPQPSYLEALRFLEDFEQEAVESGCQNAPVVLPRPHADSLWILGDKLERTWLPSELIGACGQVLGELRHFNVRAHELRNTLTHCDFRSVPLPGIANALDMIRDAQTLWAEALGGGIEPDQLAEITYADVDYPPRPRNYIGVRVRIDPSATRVARRYSDEDAEVWGP